MALLSVYDLTTSRVVEYYNRSAVQLGAGGAYHVAIEVYHQEWNFGFTIAGTGVAAVHPGGHPAHRFFKSVPLGLTDLSKEEVHAAVQVLMKEWQGDSYHCLKRNCCGFAKELAERLGVDPLPKWVDRLSRTAEGLLTPVDKFLETFESLSLACTTVTRSPECCGAKIVRPAAVDVMRSDMAVGPHHSRTL